MIESVKATVKRYNMFSSEKSVTVALSGGADSVALLFALLEIKNEFGLNVSAAHLNHCLRGEESDGDELYVRKLCDKLDVPLICDRADVLGFARDNNQSIELAARNVRYEFLERVSNGLIATAHTADDNIETVLYNLSRGTGIDGGCGIPPVRGRIVRPLILVTRADVEKYCELKGVNYRTDSTNLSDEYTRNRIRHGVVPVLKTVNTSAVKNVALFSERLRIDADYLMAEADRVYSEILLDGGLSVERLLELHPAIFTRCLLRLCEESLRISLEHTHVALITDMLKQGRKRQSILEGCYSEVQNGVLKFVRSDLSAESFSFEIDSLPFVCKGLKLTKVSKKIAIVNNLLLKNGIDYDKICGILTFRSRLPGDSIKLNGRGVTKTFKNLFNEHNIPVDKRNSIAVLADEKGVVWLSGFGVDQRVAVCEDTKNVLIIGEDKYDG